jgi:C1A family cysteine protease
MSETPTHIYDLTASPSDDRDYRYRQENSFVRDIVDLRPYDSPVEDQGSLGSCSAFAVTSAYENLVNQKYPDFYTQLSKLYHYYHTRYIEGTVFSDYGVITLRNSMRSLKLYCLCAENFWPYSVEKFNIQPSPNAYSDSYKRNIMAYARLYNFQEAINSLNDNSPVVIGARIFNNFENLNSSDSIVKFPGEYDYSLGGHAMCLVGYSMPENMFLAKNSFGKDWGQNGYCWIPFQYISDYSFDMWVFDINNQKIIYEV